MLAVISPGADFAMVTRNSMLLSRRAGLLTALGISLGVLVHVSYAMAGIGWLVARSPLFFSVLKLVGAAYLIYLGATLLRSRAVAMLSQADNAVEAGAVALAASDRQALRMGFLTNALNPKTTLFVLSLFAQVISPASPLLRQLAYGAFMSLAHLVWFSLVACAFSSALAIRCVANYRHLVERAIGVVLVLLGVLLASSALDHV